MDNENEDWIERMKRIEAAKRIVVAALTQIQLDTFHVESVLAKSCLHCFVESSLRFLSRDKTLDEIKK